MSIRKFEKRIKKKLVKKYEIPKNFYIKKKINELIFNTKSHYTALFKDYLIIDDEHEFLRRFYPDKDYKKKLKKIFNYYEKYSKIFPNYLSISESKYMYKNILKKQNMIHNLHNMKKQEEQNKKENIFYETVFNYEALNSICSQIDSFYVRNLKNIIDISFHNNSIDDINKIINQIEEEEKYNLIVFNGKPRPYKNLISYKKKIDEFSNSSLNSKLIESTPKSFINSNNVSTSINSDIFANNLSSTFYPKIQNSSINKSKIKNHKKGISQNVNIYDVNLKKLILKLDKKQNKIDYKNELNLYSVRENNLNNYKKFNNKIQTPKNFGINSTRNKIYSLTNKKLPKVIHNKDLNYSERKNSDLQDNKFNSRKSLRNKYYNISTKYSMPFDENLKYKITNNIHKFNLRK
jgi:hypothetical protein